MAKSSRFLMTAIALTACTEENGGGSGGATSTGDATGSVSVAVSVVVTSAGPATVGSGGSTSDGGGGMGGHGAGGFGGASTTTGGGANPAGGGEGGAPTPGGGEGGATVVTASSATGSSVGAGGDVGTTSGSGGAGGDGGAGGIGGADGGAGGDGGMSSATTASSSASTSQASSSASTATSTSSTGGGEECIGPVNAVTEVPGVCFGGGGVGLVTPFITTTTKQITMVRGHTLYFNPPFDTSRLLAGCGHPGPYAEQDPLLAPAHCRLETFTAPPGSYEAVRCDGTNSKQVVVEDAPPPAPNTTCATAISLDGASYAEPRIIDGLPRYYTFTVDVPGDSKLLEMSAGFPSAGRVRVSVDTTCSNTPSPGPVVELCTNGSAIRDLGVLPVGTYYITATSADPGTKYLIAKPY